MKMAEEKGENACQGDSSIQFYPPELWGLDYHFSVYNKMYIKDILQMKEYPMFPGAFSFQNHPIYKVDVIGVVVRVNENSKCFIYAVDDGTGVIPCCCFKNSFNKQADFDPGKELKDLPVSLLNKAKELSLDNEENLEGYSLGQTIHVKGKVKIFRENKEIVALYHNRVDDPMYEVMRICELPKVYAQCHDKPFQLPYKVQEALKGRHQGSETGNTEGQMIYEVKAAIKSHLEKNQEIVEVAAAELLKLKTVQEILSKKQEKTFGDEEKLGLILRTLNLIEDDGQLTRRCDRRMFYESLFHKSKLEDQVLRILNVECKKTKYAEKGCHYMHIMDELHKTFQYGKIKKSSLLFCLQKLEEQSDVIRTTNVHYVACNI